MKNLLILILMCLSVIMIYKDYNNYNKITSGYNFIYGNATYMCLKTNELVE